MPKHPRNETTLAEFTSRRRRLRSGSSLPSASSLPPSRGRARISRRNTLASSGDYAFAAAKDADPEYLVFLQHLRVEGCSYELVMPAADGSADPVRLEYEEHEGTRYRAPPPPPFPLPRQQKQRKRASETKETNNRQPERRQRTKSASANSGVTRTSPSSGEGRLMFDEDYRMFLDVLTLRDDGSMVAQWDNGVTVVYDKKNSDDEEVVLIKEAKSAKGSNVEIDLVSCEGSPPRQPPTHIDIKHLMEILRGRTPSTFNNRLMIALDKPFDKKEYDELMVLATTRKLVTDFKHLRLDSVRYETDMIGRSYLDFYPDLASQIQSTDKATALFLLRGFFFWLQNLGHDGAFMPWLATSASCMSATFIDNKISHNVNAKFSKHEL